MIIGFTGPAGSGKSTAARYLVINHDFMLIKFAGPLKAMIRTLCDQMLAPIHDREAMIERDLKGVETKVLNMHTPRHAMQTLGTEWGRNCMGEDFWVNVVRQRITSEWEAVGYDPIDPSRPAPRMVIDDVRFENEAALIRELNGNIIHVEGRGGIDGKHESEGGIIGHIKDGVVSNRRTPERMFSLLDEIVYQHL